MDAAAELKSLLRGTNKTICAAESLTVGHVQSAIASVSGSSAYFAGGLIAYNLRQKVNLLGVDRSHAEACDCVSERVAREMAAGARKTFQADIAVATTGYAEPYPEQNVTAPYAYYSIDIEGSVTSGRVDGPGLSRTEMQRHAADAVLRELVQQLRDA